MMRPSRLPRAGFVELFGPVYEHSPWIAEAAWHAGLSQDGDTPEGLAACLAAIVRQAPAERRLALLRAHPDLAGRLALAGDVAPASRREQSGAGLDRCSPEELARFQELNDRYREKFGFPFILAVRGHDRSSILEIFAKRLDHDPARELAEALEQVHLIAAHRIKAIFAAEATGT